MLKLDNTLLDELGLGGLPEDQKPAMLQHIYETLELRVGTNLANQMSDQQLEEFEKFIDEGGDANQAQALQWLETNLPNYKQVVNEVFEALKVEIKQMAPQLMAAAGAQPSAAPAQVPQTPAPPQPTGGYQAPAQPASGGYYSQQPAPQQPSVPAQPQQPYQAQAPQPSFGQQPMPQPAYQPPAQSQQQVASQPDPAATDYQAPAAPVQPMPAPQQDDQGYTFPQQQPPAGPGYPPQHPSQQ